MKRLHTLGLTLTLLGVFTLSTIIPASAQENTKVVVIKKKTDANGQQTVEEVIVTNDENDARIHEINAQSADEVVVISGNCSNHIAMHKDATCVKSKNVNVNVNEENGEKVIFIDVDGETETIRLAKGEELSEAERERLAENGVFLNHHDGVTWVGKGKHDFDFDFDLGELSEGLVNLGKGLAHIGNFDHAFAYDGGDINCAALGVYVSSSEKGGVYVNNTIGASGAEEAGLKSGDIILSIDEFPTAHYGQLHDVLAGYQPGDVVTVTYSRDGVEDRVETQLRAWKDFPSFANRRHAMITCDKANVPEETVTRKIIVIKKNKAEEPVVPENLNQSPSINDFDNNLSLSDFVAFPNPTDGKFNVQFAAEAVPTIVAVFDASGKEIFRDNVDDFNGFYSREIDLTSQARGGLVLSVEQAGKTFTEQIVLH